ncbi:hypothetical protein [Pseudobdellovibrio exovorus]|nr:hypothetical protein [Pseudobdellovibrio exovorus]
MTYFSVTQRTAVPWFESSSSAFWSPSSFSRSVSQPAFDAISETLTAARSESENQKNSALKAIEETEAPLHFAPAAATHTWNFSGTGLKESEVSSYLQNTPPKAIYFFRGNELVPISAPLGYDGDLTQYLFVSDLNTIQDIQQQREAQAEQEQAAGQDAQAADRDSTDKDSLEKPLPENAFEVVSFTAGKRDDGSVLVPVNPNILQALQGPDYSLEPFNWRDDGEMRAHLSTILSFGHGGELVLKVSGQGYLKNKAGFDFALYENAFRTGSGLNVVQEFARVGVSNSLEEDFHWFPCDPLQNILSGCLGAVPTAEGGDQFDLTVVGLTEARYIKIQDLGINKNNTSRWPTEGCDLDAVRLFHAYTQE